MTTSLQLIRHCNTCKSYNYPRNPREIPYKYPDYKEEDASSENWEEEEDLEAGTDHITNTNGSIDTLPNEDMPTDNTPWNRLLVSESSSAFREKQFSSYEFVITTSTSDTKYKHPRS